MKKTITGSLLHLSLIAAIIFMAGFIHPLAPANGKSVNQHGCMKKVPFMLRFSGIHFKGHFCGERGIRKFHDFNIKLIKAPVDPQETHKLATQHVAATGFWKWQ